jgi:hydrogenase expression/formation protein HypD
MTSLMNSDEMRFVDEFRNKALILKLETHIRYEATGNYRFMEVCGGHTAAIQRFGIPSLLPPNVRLVSGPGCPVCVTDNSFIERAVNYSRMNDVIIATFGDLMKVPGSFSSLSKEKAFGADIRIVFSSLEALEIAQENRNKRIIFLGIGFETTAPGIAVTIKEAAASGAENFFVLSALKVMPPAMEEVIKEGVAIDGFICPGHVSSITGSKVFNFISQKYKIGCVVSGFEPVDLLQSVYLLIKQVNNKAPETEVQYSRCVSEDGNARAQQMIQDVFDLSDTPWRGFGIIPASGLKIREEYKMHDAEKNIPAEITSGEENNFCICGNILRGLQSPQDCTLYSVVCTPENPVGACMVSDEGACGIFYKYQSNG